MTRRRLKRQIRRLQRRILSAAILGFGFLFLIAYAAASPFLPRR